MPDSVEENCNVNVTRKGTFRKNLLLKPCHSGGVCLTLFPKSSPASITKSSTLGAHLLTLPSVHLAAMYSLPPMCQVLSLASV